MIDSGDSKAPSGMATSEPASSAPVSREVPVINKRGLHARASAKFVQMVERFNAEVWVTRNGETVGGTSIMGLMMLAAGIGTSVTISAVGPQAQEAVDALTELMATKFGEED
jgi:phosphocarrier protein